MPRGFKPISFQKLKVGRHIKSTKIHYSWKFKIHKQEAKIDLFLSRLSGKRKILLNNIPYSTEKKSSTVYGNYPVLIGKVVAVVYEEADNSFDLRVLNLSFAEHYRSHGLGDTEDYFKPSLEDDPSPVKTSNILQSSRAPPSNKQNELIASSNIKRFNSHSTIAQQSRLNKNPILEDLIDFSEAKEKPMYEKDTHSQYKSAVSNEVNLIDINWPSSEAKDPFKIESRHKVFSQQPQIPFTNDPFNTIQTPPWLLQQKYN